MISTEVEEAIRERDINGVVLMGIEVRENPFTSFSHST
jgi:hypothetical protein